jgi:hypothetical protein
MITISEYSHNSAQKTVTFTVDLIEEECEVSIGEMSPGNYHIMQGRKKSDMKSDNLKTALLKLLKQLEKQRDELLEQVRKRIVI